MFRQIVYVSTCDTQDIGPIAGPILDASRRNNPRLGLTGLLAAARGTFLQVLEGPPDAVAAMLQTISGDPRHHDMIALIERSVETRAFGEWSMAWAELPAASPLAGQVHRLGNVDGTLPNAAGPNGDIVVLLRSFIRTNLGQGAFLDGRLSAGSHTI